MPERKTRVPLAGPGGAITLVDAVDVVVSESTERWTEIHLEDGSTIRIKPVVLGAARIEGQYDNEGNPMYYLKVNQVMTVASSPDHLRKGGGGTPKGVQ